MNVKFFYKHQNPNIPNLFEYYTISIRSGYDEPHYDDEMGRFIARNGKDIIIRYVFPEGNGGGIIIFYDEKTTETL